MTRSWLDIELPAFDDNELLYEAQVTGNKVRCIHKSLAEGPLKSAYTHEDLDQAVDYLHCLLEEIEVRGLEWHAY
jgi:hypothetical protein